VLANVPTSLEDDDLLVGEVVGIRVELRTSPNDGVGQVTLYQLTPQALAAKSQDVFTAAIENKKPVLEAYRTHGYETVLLFDIDRALATRHSALNALASLLPLCEPGIDDAYLIEAHRGHPGPPAVTWAQARGSHCGALPACVADGAGVSNPFPLLPLIDASGLHHPYS
jgi:hypothetical protein